MKTRLPISTISYNTEPFLFGTLERLRKSKIITRWFYIYHNREDDETKDHIHLYIEPSKAILTDDLADSFLEVQLNGDKPLKVLPFRNSKFDDWYLYACHNTAYLLSKGEKRKYHYKPSDFVVWDSDDFDTLVRQVDRKTQIGYIPLIVMAQSRGETLGDFLLHNNIPINQAFAYSKMWSELVLSEGSMAEVSEAVAEHTEQKLHLQEPKKQK